MGYTDSIAFFDYVETHFWDFIRREYALEVDFDETAKGQLAEIRERLQAALTRARELVITLALVEVVKQTEGRLELTKALARLNDTSFGTIRQLEGEMAEVAREGLSAEDRCRRSRTICSLLLLLTFETGYSRQAERLVEKAVAKLNLATELGRRAKDENFGRTNDVYLNNITARIDYLEFLKDDVFQKLRALPSGLNKTRRFRVATGLVLASLAQEFRADEESFRASATEISSVLTEMQARAERWLERSGD